MAHKLRGSAGSVGAEEIATISHAAEAGLRSGAWTEAERAVAELRPALAGVGEAIAAIGA